MPRNHPNPRFALLSGFDARPWDGVTLYSRGGVDVYPYATGSGLIYDDAVGFLCGRSACPDNCPSELMDAVSLLPGIEIGIDSDDRAFIRYPQIHGIFNLTLTPTTPGDPVYGWTSGVVNVPVLGGGWYTYTAPSDWPRGPVGHVAGIVGVNPFSIPPSQDTSTLFRASTLVDADSARGLLNLTESEYGETGLPCAWWVDMDGHVVTEAAGVLVWASTTFRDRLGFTGAEVAQVVGLGRRYRATYPLPGCIVPSRPLDSIILESETKAEAAPLTDSSYTSNYVATHNRHKCTAFLDGPADAADLTRHWHRACKPYLYPGARATLYQDWGDSRRAAWRGSYSTLSTPEPVGQGDEGGYRGRIIGSLTTGAVTESTFANRIRWRSPLAFTLQTDDTV